MMLLVENYANHIKNELKVKTQNTDFNTYGIQNPYRFSIPNTQNSFYNFNSNPNHNNELIYLTKIGGFMRGMKKLPCMEILPSSN
jgi:hypothetical protein